jgi:mannose-6-phosphate isomerase-like protein (cupin superfamily)
MTSHNELCTKKQLGWSSAYFDGKAFEMTTSSKRKKIVTIKKEGNTYIESALYYSAADNTKMDHKTTDTWSVENGQLILDRKDENLDNGETWESKATYEKQ